MADRGEKYNNAGGFDPTLADPVGSSNAAEGSLSYQPVGLDLVRRPNGARNKSNATKTVVMPRFGFAWQATNKWVVRGGVGQYASLWSEDTVGGPMGFGSGAVGSANVGNLATTPVVQLSGSGSGICPFLRRYSPHPFSLTLPLQQSLAPREAAG